MEIRPHVRIQFAERLDNRVVIGFDDGMQAVYSASLLYEVLGKAERIQEDDEAPRSEYEV